MAGCTMCKAAVHNYVLAPCPRLTIPHSNKAGRPFMHACASSAHKHGLLAPVASAWVCTGLCTRRWHVQCTATGEATRPETIRQTSQINPLVDLLLCLCNQSYSCLELLYSDPTLSPSIQRLSIQSTPVNPSTIVNLCTPVNLTMDGIQP